jgi:hypothetical protein
MSLEDTQQKSASYLQNNAVKKMLNWAKSHFQNSEEKKFQIRFLSIQFQNYLKMTFLYPSYIYIKQKIIIQFLLHASRVKILTFSSRQFSFLTKIFFFPKAYLKHWKIKSFSQKRFILALTCLQNTSKAKKPEKNPSKGSKIKVFGTNFSLYQVLEHSHWQNCISYCILPIPPRELKFFHNVEYIEGYNRVKFSLQLGFK